MAGGFIQAHQFCEVTPVGLVVAGNPDDSLTGALGQVDGLTPGIFTLINVAGEHNHISIGVNANLAKMCFFTRKEFQVDIGDRLNFHLH
jgi:hypothetical protein